MGPSVGGARGTNFFLTLFHLTKNMTSPDRVIVIIIIIIVFVMFGANNNVQKNKKNDLASSR